MAKTNPETTAIALMGKDVSYIQADIAKIQTSFKEMAINFVPKTDYVEHLKEDADHETRIRYLESNVWKALGALALVTFALPIILHYLHL